MKEAAAQDLKKNIRNNAKGLFFGLKNYLKELLDFR